MVRAALKAQIVVAVTIVVGLASGGPAGAWTGREESRMVVGDGRIVSASIPSGQDAVLEVAVRNLDGRRLRRLRVALPDRSAAGAATFGDPQIDAVAVDHETAFVQVGWCSGGPEPTCSPRVVALIDTRSGAMQNVVRGTLAREGDNVSYLYGTIDASGRAQLLDPATGAWRGTLPSATVDRVTLSGRLALVVSGNDRWFDAGLKRGTGPSRASVVDVRTGKRRFTISGRRIATAAGGRIDDLRLMPDGSLGVHVSRSRQDTPLRPVSVTRSGDVRRLRHAIPGATSVGTTAHGSRVLLSVQDDRGDRRSCEAVWLTTASGARARRLFSRYRVPDGLPTSWNGTDAVWRSLARRGSSGSFVRVERHLRERVLHTSALPACRARR